MSAIENRFARGEYTALVREFIDTDAPAVSAKETAFLIGALVFTGRREDAAFVFKKTTSIAPSIAARIIARFFLGIGASRDSKYDEARTLFAANFAELTSSSIDDELKFYIHQGFGFYRNLSSRYAKSRVWAERAWRHAFASKVPFAMLLALDLRGHCLVRLGLITRGLKALEDAKRIAEDLDQSSIAQTLQISISSFRSQFGLTENALEELEELLRKTNVSNTYSRANLIHELARAYTVSGDAASAASILQKGLEETFRHGHPRQKATYLARRAYLDWLQGSVEQAASRVEEGLSLIEGDSDVSHRIELLGMLAKIRKDELIEQEIANLTLQTGRTKRVSGDDVIGQLVDRMRKDLGAVEPRAEAEERGWLGLLREGHVSRAGATVLAIDLLPGRLVVFDRGNVGTSKEKVSEILRRILLVLSHGPVDKRRLVETVWGYSYDSLRHDSMIYSAIHRLRALLGEFDSLLIANEVGYQWARKVEVKVIERKFESAMSDLSIIEGGSAERGLNYRQILALESLASERALTGEAYAQKFAVSKPTAVRDLTEMVQKGVLKKIGRARATTYIAMEVLK